MSALSVADERILRGAPASITCQFLDQDGDPADPGTVTIGVTKADGTVVVASGTATTGTSTAPRAYSLAAVSTLEMLTASWTSSTHGVQTTHVEVVERYYFSVAAARAWKTGGMNDATTYTDAQIKAGRSEVEQEFERFCWAFVPRFVRHELMATGRSSALVVPDQKLRSLRSVKEIATDGSTSYTWTAADIAATSVATSGILTRLDGAVWSAGKIVVEYEHGFDSPPPDVLDAAIARLRYRINAQRSAVPDRASSFTSGDGGTYSLLVPGRGSSLTAQPEVDVVLNDPRYRRVSPMVA